MSKWYEVEMQVLIIYAVEVKDDENENQANYAAEMDYTGKGRVTVIAKPIPATHLSMIVENADRLLPIDVDKFCSAKDDDE